MKFHDSLCLCSNCIDPKLWKLLDCLVETYLGTCSDCFSKTYVSINMSLCEHCYRDWEWSMWN